jgi:hypothetical protein
MDFMPKKILVIISNPRGTSNLNLLPEIRDLQEALQRAQDKACFSIEWRIAKRQNDLHRYILDVNPQILHFCGHGTKQGLVLEDDTGAVKVVSNEVLTELLRTFADCIECVVLNACHSSSLADDLVQHLNYVIGMNQAVSDDIAISFSEGFYDALGAGRSYERAFEIAKSVVFGKENSRTENSRKIEVVDENGEPVSGRRQEYLIPVLKINPNPTDIKPPRQNLESHSAVKLHWLSIKPLQMPPLPKHFVERTQHQQVVKAELLCESAKVGTLVVSAIYGLGGIGKSVLASKMTHDPDIQKHFSDGILWATLGQSPDILPLLSGWIQALGDRDYKPTAVESASNHLRTLLYDKRTLLVVDDVWNSDHLEPFRVGGERSCVLVTTREARISEARRYDLDVMEPEQALALMSQKLSTPLSETAYQQAREFAARVGYLPLALELAASQIEEGVTWQELLEDFKSEVARLETLDIYDQSEKPEDEKRRKYSVLACFNLSLKQLSTQQLRQFAWLGIVPEDANLTQEMAETLWQVTARQAGSILRTFRAKSLVLQGVSQADERPSYRMHDLMHDLAQRLLMSPPQPVRIEDMPGLGLTKSEAHSALLECYCAKTQNGSWHTLPDDGYIYAHLTWHMEQADQPHEIHRLLRASNENGHNAWFEACEALGQTTLFVKDVARAYQLAEQQYAKDNVETVGLQCRYALIYASLNSMASALPPELIVALVKGKHWNPIQGLACIRQIQETSKRVEAIRSLSPHLPQSLLPEILTIVEELQPESNRARVLIDLLPSLSETLLPKVLEIVKGLQSESSRSWVLSEVVSRLPESLLPEALGVVKGLQPEPTRIWVLSKLLLRLPESLQPEILELVRGIQSEFERASSLILLLPHIPDLLSEVLGIVREIQSESDRASVLISLLPHIPDLLSEVLGIVREIQSESDRASALISLVPYVPEILLLRVLEEIQEIKSGADCARVLVSFAPYLSEILPEALAVVRRIQSNPDRAWALSAFVHQMPELLPEALVVVRDIQSESSRSFKLSLLVPHLPKDLLVEALNVVREIQSEPERASALSIFSPHLAELVLEALAILQGIQSESEQTKVLSKFIPCLPKTALLEALVIVKRMQFEPEKARALIAFVPHLPEVLSDLLPIVKGIQSESERVDVLNAFIPYLPKTMFPEIFSIIQEIQSEFERANVLSEFIPSLQKQKKILPEVLKIVRDIQNKSERARLLNGLVKYSPDLLPEALAAVRGIQDKSNRAWALNELVPHLPETMLPEALEIVRDFQDRSDRASTLITFVPWLPRRLLPEALEIVRGIQSEPFYASALSSFVPYLPDLLPEVLDTIRGIQSEFERVKLLSALELDLPELVSEILDIVRGIQSEFDQANVLNELLPYLPERFLPEALEITRNIQSEPNRANALISFASHLPELALETLEVVGRIQSESSRARALAKLVPYLPESLLADAQEIAIGIRSESDRKNALISFMLYQPELLLNEWNEMRRSISSESDQARTLIMLIPYLSESLLSETLEVIQEMQSEPDCFFVLNELVPFLPKPLFPEVLEIVKRLQSEPYRARLLYNLVPHLPDELLNIALQMARELRDFHNRATVFQSLASKLSLISTDTDLWCEMLRMLTYLRRQELMLSFPGLTAHIADKFGKEALKEMLEAVREVNFQWK